MRSCWWGKLFRGGKSTNGEKMKTARRTSAGESTALTHWPRSDPESRTLTHTPHKFTLIHIHIILLLRFPRACTLHSDSACLLRSFNSPPIINVIIYPVTQPAQSVSSTLRAELAKRGCPAAGTSAKIPGQQCCVCQHSQAPHNAIVTRAQNIFYIIRPG